MPQWIMSTWRPLSRRFGPDEEEVLAEGVPPWLVSSLTTWLDEQFNIPSRHALVLAAVRLLRWPIGGSEQTLWLTFRQRWAQPEDLLDLVDFVLSCSSPAPPDVERLEAYLRQAGSAWTVSVVDFDEEGGRLVRRLPVDVGERVDTLAAVADRTGDYLRSAKGHLYGRNPSPSDAYRDAVRAVEAAAKPVVSPKAALATLGTVKATIRDAPDGKFRFSMQPRRGTDSKTTVVAMLELLYAGQHDRHGDPAAPASVSQEEAEAAFHLALTLVHWFRSGAIAMV